MNQASLRAEQLYTRAPDLELRLTAAQGRLASLRAEQLYTSAPDLELRLTAAQGHLASLRAEQLYTSAPDLELKLTAAQGYLASFLVTLPLTVPALKLRLTAAQNPRASLHATLPLTVPALKLRLTAAQNPRASLHATLPLTAVPGLRLSALLAQTVRASFLATLPPLSPLPGLQASAILTRILDLTDSAGTQISSRHQNARQRGHGLTTRQQQMLTRTATTAPLHQDALRLTQATRLRHAETEHFEQHASSRHQQAIPLAGGCALSSQDSIRLLNRFFGHHQNADHIRIGINLRQANAQRLAKSSPARWSNAIRVSAGVVFDVNNALRTATRSFHPWGQAIVLPFDGWGRGHTWGDADPPEPPPPTPPPGTPFIYGLHLFIMNTFTLFRASDGHPIEVRDFQAQVDAESWGWSFSATIPAHEQAIVLSPMGDPVEVIATLNGHPLNFLVETISRERVFPQSWLTIGGRSKSAMLAMPYATVRAYDNPMDRTAQQLMEDALSINGVPIGFDLIWGLIDWLVPAGAWSFHGTPIEAAIRIAEAGGGYIQAHDTDATLIIRPYYPTLPRDWASLAAQHSLAENYTAAETIELVDKAPYNAVWCTGAAQGRKDRIRLAGTAGDTPAPMIVDPLMTHPDATSQRGIRVLGDTGRQALISLRMPIAETGIIHPGDIIDYSFQGNTKRGIARSTAIDYQHPQAWQTIGVETHGQPL